MQDDPQDILHELNLTFDDLKYGLRTKVDKDMHDALWEWSNKLTNSNMSSIMRIAISLGLKQLEERWPNRVPNVRGVVYGRRKWLRKEAAIQRIHRAAVELERRYDPDYYAAMEKYAEKEGLEWPPTEIDRVQIDPTLKRVMSRLETILSERSPVTLRDVYHGLSGIDADGAREAIFQLEELGAVELSGSRSRRTSLQIKWADVKASD